MTAPGRRWFRFTLRTLFVMVTLLGIALCWLGWQRRVVHNRADLMHWARENQMWSCLTVSDLRQTLPVLRASGSADYSLAPYEGVPQVSAIRQWMGDEALAKMSFREPPPVEKQAELRAAFPEADFHWQSQGFDD